MAEEQKQLSPKETLVLLINSALTAIKGGDQLLIQYANNNLGQFLEKAEITIPEPEEAAEVVEE